MCTEPVNSRTRMRTWVLETAGLGSFPNIPTHHIPIPVEKALGNPYPGSSVRIHKGKTLCYMHCSNLIQPSTNFDLYQRLLSSLVPFNPYHHPIFTQQLNVKSHYITPEFKTFHI